MCHATDYFISKTGFSALLRNLEAKRKDDKNLMWQCILERKYIAGIY